MRKLVFVTGEYPYGKGETFIENEILYLSKEFDEVYIFAAFANKQSSLYMRETPSNCVPFYGTVGESKKYQINFVRFPILKQIVPCMSSGNILRFVNEGLRMYHLALTSGYQIEPFIEKMDISSEDTIVVYSYWLHAMGMIALMIFESLKEKGIEVKKIARTHGFDLYSERIGMNFLPFQEWMLYKFDLICPCSISGTKYLKNKFPKYAEKIETSYLGVTDQFDMIFPQKRDVFHMVSCSSITSVKRVERIAESLSLVTGYRIKWTHFGDGDLMERTKDVAAKLPDNIITDFMGRVPNQQIYDFFNNNNVNLFVNASTSEGLPVSIMEAISFGIPTIATDVGGTSEIVEDGINGFLLRENFTNQELGEAIINVIQMPSDKYETMCRYSRKKYEELFSAEKNYKVFCDKLLATGEQDVTRY